MQSMRKNGVHLAVALALAAPLSAWATNGMNLEAYGPIAGGMGGASFAYDNGTAAVANNPATIGLMAQGSRLDVALGFLGPNVSSSMTGMPDADSSADAFYMPAVGYAHKQGQTSYGIGLFGQGGMGTEYDGNSFLAAGSGKTVRSEVGVGRLLIPLTYDVNDKLTIGGSLDYVWATMDLRMAMSGAQFGDMVSALGGSQTFGTASGSMVTGMVGMITGGQLDPNGPVNWTRFDFSNSSAFFGEAFGDGLAAKLGMAYKVNERLSVGATYHSKTNLSDMSTGNATVSMNVNMDDGLLAGGSPTGTYSPVSVPVTGRIKVKDFQWPETYGIGLAFQATDKVMLAADVKHIGWSDVMENFQMSFTADANQDNPLAAGFAGGTLDASMIQNWKDQTVLALGASVQTTQQLALRVGFNTSTNPVPDKYMNPLFPAIIKSHYTVGGGYEINTASSINASFTYAPEVEATNGGGVTTTHSQFNWQVMYSHLF